jgi:electron transport complex protein RnfD
MVGRAFLTACFGIMMTTWALPAATEVDTTTVATPLALSKQAIKSPDVTAEPVNDLLTESFIGQTGGCLGETSAMALLVGGIYLLIRRTITFHIPLAVLSSALLLAAVAWFANPEDYAWPLLHLTTGGLMLGAFFIATDPVTAPLSTKGMWIFGIGLGSLVMIIRLLGEYPEGVMYAVLLMNAVTPLIDRMCKLTPAGGKPQNA